MTVGIRPRKDSVDVYPKFIVKKTKDLMTRGGDFFAVWVADKGLWSTDEDDVNRLIDKELDAYAEKYKSMTDVPLHICHMWDAETGSVDTWHKYVQKQLRENYKQLDEKIIFSNTETKKEDYATKKLPYPLEDGEPVAWNELIGILYSEEEKRKIEWTIGCIVSGDSIKTQKFAVIYGQRGTGKSTVLNIIEMLFDGYCASFSAKALGSATNQFALEAFKNNPLVAIQHDGDLSHIEDNTRLNSLVSHEKMLVNAKFEKMYQTKFISFLYMGTNRPVKISDAKSGILRRLIDIIPTGKKVSIKDYNTLFKQIKFELGKIANQCLNVYLEDKHYYDDYVPIRMMAATNDVYNFVSEYAPIFADEEQVTAKVAFKRYNQFCDDSNIPQNYRFSLRLFKEELKNYFKTFKEIDISDEGNIVRDIYSDFAMDKLTGKMKTEIVSINSFLNLKKQKSIFDKVCSDLPAQYAKKDGTPEKKWCDVKTVLKDLSTDKLHYVNLPPEHIVIDFDKQDAEGNKSLEENIKAALEFPPTYAEVSKSGEGLHLHYIYTGDTSALSRIFADNIEVKVFTGDQTLRRKLTLCNDLDISTISSGLPLKENKPMINFDGFKSEKALKNMIEKNLRKEIIPFTKPSIDLIYKDLESAYASGLQYDVTDMRNAIIAFAISSTHNAQTCMETVGKMRFKSSSDTDIQTEDSEEELVMFDVESYPNLFLLCYKYYGKDKPVMSIFNPKPEDIEPLLKKRLVGFNNRRYDNHMLYACLMGYSPKELSKLSQRIINGERDCFFSSAYSISYTDIYDFCATKQSLKKWEIELGINHKEMDIPWDEPVPKDRWHEVAEYCKNDVLATEAVWDANQADFTAREILADITGMSVNDSTNSLTTKFIFGNDRHPQSQFNYRFMGDLSDVSLYTVPNLDCDWDYTLFDSKGRPIFPGYTFEYDSNRKKYISTYRDEEVGEGGYVFSKPGMYRNVICFDVRSEHPWSVINENLFGDVYTERFKQIVELRAAIKAKDFDSAKKMLNGAVAKYLDDASSAKALSYALKIAINMVYGQTFTAYDNAFRDPRNTDNIVAKRGSCFMVNLRHEVENHGFEVIHCKTDSIKVVDPTPEIAQFIMDYGKLYGYSFEIEAEYDRICLVNKSVYIAKYKDGDWTATGEQFAVPYVFKNLFSHEKIIFKDLCETFSVKSSLYLDMNDSLPDVSEYEKELKKAIKAEDKALIDELTEKIAKGHSYNFVGRVGQFTPVTDICHGGLLMRKDNNGKYAYASDAKGYRWLESIVAKMLIKDDKFDEVVDMRFYRRLVDNAIEAISEYGDFESFIA